MARLYAAADGTILRFLQNGAEEQQHPTPPEGATLTLSFDPATNADALAALQSDWNRCSLPNGILTVDGLPVPINAPSQQYQQRQMIAVIAGDVAGAPDSPLKDAVLALEAGTATNAEMQLVLGMMLHEFGAMIRRFGIEELT